MTTVLIVLLLAGYIMLGYLTHNQLEHIKSLEELNTTIYEKYMKDMYNQKQSYLEVQHNSQREYERLFHRYHALRDSLRATYSLENVRVTAYAPYDNQSGICADSNPNRTSTGSTPGWGTIAVDPNVIPYGTLLYVPGYGVGIASDTGAALRLHQGIAIDVYMDTYQQAIEWGKQTLDIIVLGIVEKEGLVGLRFVKEEVDE